ncbi:sigma-70 family RNA polymerase sigma factor [Calycomorphotria hydatis]|uniref:RNA polymerase sigma factor n=1 Tax=Calycomorphotria hydatis TaxID=2528027 RepID=A0A517T8J9_9PLAN|nr:sigma-70 family RNA polymerase sigma factor [Calycomorphotria hydatis]QDT64712.1 RNA polymerase sigma factor [Calycomorphotria hydatis]
MKRFTEEIATQGLGDIGSRKQRFGVALEGAYDRIFACVLTLIPYRNDAEDVVQETCSILWEKFDEFDPDRDFVRWSCGIAYRQARNFLRKKYRQKGLCLSESVAHKVEKMRTGSSELLELRREKLLECLQDFREDDQMFLHEIYSGQTTVVKYAKHHRLRLGSLYVKLDRLRKRLLDCILRKMMKEHE